MKINQIALFALFGITAGVQADVANTTTATATNKDQFITLYTKVVNLAGRYLAFATWHGDQFTNPKVTATMPYFVEELHHGKKLLTELDYALKECPLTRSIEDAPLAHVIKTTHEIASDLAKLLTKLEIALNVGWKTRQKTTPLKYAWQELSPLEKQVRAEMTRISNKMRAIHTCLKECLPDSNESRELINGVRGLQVAIQSELKKPGSGVMDIRKALQYRLARA